METQLYTWFSKQREQNIPIKGDIFKAKVKYLFEKLKKNGESFSIIVCRFIFGKEKSIRQVNICSNNYPQFLRLKICHVFLFNRSNLIN